jgi:selenocysteine-specific elongation factor
MAISIIVGTAGHIDHGKTALVRALTGVDADRLPEEKKRGITIDIGFADLDLGEVRIGFVDVPGHERFVKNMLAGAHGIDAVALVIAADESVMPQTREHFDICRLLGVEQGIIVLTKKDLVDGELLQLAKAEAEDLVKGSFLEGAPIVAVSSRTGEGVEELKRAMREIGAGIHERSSEYVMRLPIDRSFTMKGFGAVVTGTLISGEISEADELELLPSGTRVRVRGVQVHGSSVKTAVAGQRTAINLGGIDSAAIERGMVLAPAGRLRPTQIVDASIQILDDAPRSLRSRQRVRVHIGAAEVLARVRVLQADGEIKPGAKGVAQLRFETPVVGVLGDRFILRAYSPQITIGGGTILEAFATRHRARDLSAARDALKVLSEGDRKQQLISYVNSAGSRGMARDEIAARTGWRSEVISASAREAIESGEVIEIDKVLITRAAVEELNTKIIDAITAHHKREPLSRGLQREILREQFFAGVSGETFRAFMARLEEGGAFVSEKDIVRLRDHTRELSTQDARDRDALEQVFRIAGLAAPTLAEAFATAALKPSDPRGRKLLQMLIDSGVLIKVQGDMLFHREALDDLTRKLRAYTEASAERVIDVPTFKELAAISRKYAIPLLEYLDRERITRREGDKRRII